MEPKTSKRHLVTAALPYANGPMHIGHLAGVYIPSDIYVRYLRLKQKDVLFICGSDEHGVPITIKAKKEGKTPKQVVDNYHAINSQALKEFGISFDIFSRTSNKIHHKTASDFFKTLHEKNVFVEKESDNFFDTEANQFLADRYIVGTCPRCNNDNAYGDQCESCGTTLSPSELKRPRSALSGSTPIKKKTKHWYIPLDVFQPKLESWLKTKTNWKKNVIGQCFSWINEGLKPRAVTRDLSWGVRVPVKNAEGKVLYVWFDAPIGYISATKELTENWKDYWMSEDTSLIHFIGKDNIVFHCIIFPAMLMAHGGYVLPKNVPANEFLNLENDKISTSKNHAVWLPEYLKDFPNGQDLLRYVLTANMPEQKDNNFSWEEFKEKINNELVAVYGNFVNRTTVLLHKYFDGKVPSEGENKGKKELSKKITTLKKAVSASLENFKFKDALNSVMEIARVGNKYLADRKPWEQIKTDEKSVKTTLFNCVQIMGALAVHSHPFLPFTFQKFQEMMPSLSQEWDAEKFEYVPENTKVKNGGILFRKIEDEEIQQQKEKLENLPTKEPSSPQIEFDDFLKVSLQVGTIEDAETVSKSKKLLLLKIRDGKKVRTILSGISEYYSPKEIIGKQVCFVENLKPRKIMGVESQGMVLFAKTKEGALTFVSPETLAMDGSPVE